MWLGESPSDPTYYNEAFLRFDLTSLAGTTIDIAQLQVYPYHQYYNAPTATNTWLRRVTASWAENTITWNNKPAITTTGTIVAGLVEGERSSFIMTAMVQGWVSGTFPNYGLRLDENGNGETYWKRLISSEYATNTSPRLNVTYHTPTATPTTPTGWRNSRTLSWTYSDTAGHAQSNYEFDVDNNSDFSSLVYDGPSTAGAATSAAIPGSVTLSSGTTHYWRIRVKDGTSWSPWATSSFQWDATAPSTTIAVNNGSAYATATGVTLNVTASDAHSGVATTQASNDNSTYSAVSGTAPAWTLTSANGTRTVWYRVTDVAGNATTVSDAIVLDTVNPSASISVANGAAWATSTGVTLNVSATDATSGVATTQASNDNTTYTAVSGSTPAWTLTTANGTKTVWYRVTDAAGRSTTVSDTIGLDTVNPTGTIAISNGATTTASANVTLNVTSGDATSGVAATAASNDNVTFTPVSGATPAWTLTAGDGLKTVWYRVTDVAGRSTTVSDTITLSTDTTAPDSPSVPDLDAGSDSGISSVDNITNDTTPTFTGQAEANSTVKLYSDGALKGSATAIGSGAWTVTTATLVDGVHSITVTATDASNNTSAPSGPLSVTIDTVAPAAPSTPDLDPASDTGGSNTDNRTTDDTPTLTGTAEGDTLLTLLEGTTSLGTTTAVAGVWSITSGSLADGAHSITAVAADVAGNAGPASSALVVTVVPAEVGLLWPASDGLLFEQETLAAETIGDPVASMEFLVDGVVVGTTTTQPFEVTWDTTTATAGTHVFEARATLVAGGSVMSTSVSAIVDNTLSSVDRLEADLASNRMTIDEYALNGVYAAMAPTAMSERYRSPVLSTSPIDVGNYVAEWASLSTATQSEIASFVNQPLRGEQWAPTSDVGVSSPDFDGCTTHMNGPYSVTTCEKVTPHFRITYAMGAASTATTVAMVDDSPANRYPDRVDLVEDALESAFEVFMESGGMAFASPLEGSERIHVNLTDPAGSDGLAGPSLLGLPASIMIDPSSDRISLYTGPHELFHVIQNGYKTTADILYLERQFWYEATAEWATHQYLVRSGQTDTSYMSNLHSYLGEPEIGLEVADSTQRQYGKFIFGEYLDEHYSPNAVRRTWELIGTGNAVDESFKNLAAEHTETLDQLLSDYAEFIYRFEFIDSAEESWRNVLEARSTAETFTAGDDLSPLARPRRDRHDFAQDETQWDQATIEMGGMAFIDLAPTPGTTGTFQVRVTRPNDAIIGRLLSWGTYPADCDATDLSFVGNVGTAQVVLPAGCNFATLILVHADPLSPFNGTATVDWEATFSPILLTIDNFNRTSEPGDRFGESSLGPTWVSGPSTPFTARAVPPDAFEIDGASGVIWGHPNAQVGSYADPWTSLEVSRSLPLDIEMRFKMDPYAWVDADGTFEINFVLGNAPDYSAMTSRVGLDLYGFDEGTAWLGLIGTWGEPYVEVPFTVDTWYRYRLRIEEGQVMHKIWLDSEFEPGWTVVDTAPQGQSLTLDPSHLWIMNSNYGVKLYFDWIGLR